MFTVGDSVLVGPLGQWPLLLILTIAVFLVWETNRLTERFQNRISAFFNNKVHPLIVQFLISMVNVIVICSSIIFISQELFNVPVFHLTNLKLLTAFGFRINLFLQCIAAIVFFMNKLKQTQLEGEQLKKESIEAQFEALRNQINPHFLFNSLNVLSSLVYKDADTSATFISQLSKVYRYLLYTQESPVVPVKEELDFIDAYVFLLQIRYGENIEIEKSISADSQKFYIAPASLQLLIENAIKHNIVSKKNPLRIVIVAHGGFISVINNLQEKTVKEPSTQKGLKNIERRYAFLSNHKVVIEKQLESFSVKLPLLEVTV